MVKMVFLGRAFPQDDENVHLELKRKTSVEGTGREAHAC